MKIYKLLALSLCSFLFLIISPLQVHADWEKVPGAYAGTDVYPNLYSTEAISSNDVWSVGQYYPEGNTKKPLIEHWDGDVWEIVPSDIGSDSGSLTSVSGVSSNNVWAVGDRFDGTETRQLIQHWDGTSWTDVFASESGTRLYSVSARASNDVWAVGSQSCPTNFGAPCPLIKHYDGSTWHTISPALPSNISYAQIVSISAKATDDIWAVGNGQVVDGSNLVNKGLLMHWNGSTWSIEPVPVSGESTLFSVSMNAGNDVWAVGSKACASNNDCLLALHYDGTDWTEVETPTVVNGEDIEAGVGQSVKATSSDDVWMVGSYSSASPSGNLNYPLIEHWDGTEWTITEGLFAKTSHVLQGVDAISSNDIWAVGAFQDLPNSIAQEELIFHFTPKPPVVVIPGIMGSNFSVTQTFDPNINDCFNQEYDFNPGDRVWFDITKMIPDYICGNYLNALKLQNNGQTSSYSQIGLDGSLVSAVNPLNGNNIGYHDTLPYLASQGYVEGENLFIFPYDWRKDIASNTELLDIKIDAILASSSSQKVDILAHSMGGLLARDYIRTQDHADKVHTLVELGTPAAGTPKALAYLLYATCLKALGPICAINPTEVNSLAQNFTGFFELLPSKEYYQLYSDANQYPFNDVRDLDGNGVTGKLTYNQLHTYLDNLNKNMTAFDTAEGFQDNLDQSDTNGVTTYMIAGSGQDTWGQLFNYVWSNSQQVKNDAIITDGDGTVPVKSATYGENNGVFYVNQNHEDLVANGPALTMAVNLLKGETSLISGVHDMPIGVSGKVVSVHSPVELNLYDDQNRHTGIKEDGTVEEGIPGSSYDILGDAKFIYVPDGGQYHLTTKATAAGHFDLKIKTYENNEITQQVLFLNVDQTNQTSSSASLDTESPTLSVDTNGDGTTDQTLEPTYNLTGDDAADYAPPFTSASLFPAPDEDDEYSNPVTVSLTATASAGFTVANTYYKIDGGSQQTYSAPFTVSDAGSHTILYWSVDDAGLVEAQNTQDFTIADTEVKIEASPISGTKSVGAPFMVDIKISDNADAFNAARATVTVSSNLTINSVSNPRSNACNLRYTQTPTTSNPSFAGAIYGDPATNCTVYTLVLTPNAAGTGTVTITNGSIKSYEDSSELLTGVTNASFTLGNGPTPTPTGELSFTITNQTLTYKTDFNLSGTKLSSLLHIFVNGSDDDSTYPTATSWSVPVTLNLGANNYTIYGTDNENNQTATQTVSVNRHTLGDINGDGEIDLIDASLFAVDWDKTEDLTYVLSDMNDDGTIDLTDLSILAKLEQLF